MIRVTLPRMKRFLPLVVLVACGSSEPPARSPQQRTEDSAASVDALRSSKFPVAVTAATTALASDPRNARAAAVRAIATYQLATHDLVSQLSEVVDAAEDLKFFDHAGGRAAWQAWLDKLAVIDRDLAIVAADPSFSLELCVACWSFDWNRNGSIDERDARTLELEYDGKGEVIPEGDPRRRPTFRFDVGDADWARAMLSFQRAFGELVLAYKWSELDKLFGMKEPKVTIRLDDRVRVQRARELVIAGLGYADRCRAAYLAETDDDREWVPNPKQQSHPIPLDVDAKLYETWAGVTGDVRRMLASEEGISIRELANLIDDDLGAFAPDAYIDLGAMLSSPKDFSVDFARIDGRPSPAAIDGLVRELLGNGYKQQMKPSPLLGRLRAMKQDLERGEDTVERKLRYLFWLN